jgi:hypothetical protein
VNFDVVALEFIEPAPVVGFGVEKTYAFHAHPPPRFLLLWQISPWNIWTDTGKFRFLYGREDMPDSEIYQSIQQNSLTERQAIDIMISIRKERLKSQGHAARSARRAGA